LAAETGKSCKKIGFLGRPTEYPEENLLLARKMELQPQLNE
jgi:hypothetical protein